MNQETILTQQEKEDIKILMRLGDSEILAIETILKIRETEIDKQFYRFGYEN
jgi:hypothetical protein